MGREISLNYWYFFGLIAGFVRPTWINVARKVNGASCTASSQSEPRICDRVIDGSIFAWKYWRPTYEHPSVGSWIQVI